VRDNQDSELHRVNREQTINANKSELNPFVFREELFLVEPNTGMANESNCTLFDSVLFGALGEGPLYVNVIVWLFCDTRLGGG
jgi:hypothetical protein